MNKLKLFWMSFKKEGKFILRDRRSIFTSIVSGLFLTPALFGLLEVIEDRQANQVENSVLQVAFDGENADTSKLEDYLQTLANVEILEVDSPQEALASGGIIGYFDLSTEGDIDLYRYIYDGNSNQSTLSEAEFMAIFSSFAQQERTERLTELSLQSSDIDQDIYSSSTLQSILDEVEPSQLVLFFLPYIILVGLVTGSQQYAIELTAGEKERKTLATTLSLNIPTNIIALSKISVVLIISLVSVVLNILSIFIASELFNLQEDFGFSVGLDQLFYLSIVLLPLAMLLASIIVVIGLYARNQKEAGLYLTPLLISSIGFGFATNAFDANTDGPVFLTPLLGHIGVIKQILLNEINMGNISMVVLSSIFLVAIALIVAIRLFKSEKVIFRQ